MHKLNAIFTFWFALARIAKYEAVLNKNIKNSEDINYLNFMDNVKLSIFIQDNQTRFSNKKAYFY